MSRIASLALFAGLLAALAPCVVDAEVIMYVYQSGNNVITSASGTLDITDLGGKSSGSGSPYLEPDLATLIVGPNALTDWDRYSTGITGPANFGTGGMANPDSSSGDFFGVNGKNGALYVPSGYASGANLSGTATYNNTTLANLGLTTNTYTYTWGTGAHADRLVVKVGTAPPAPEPASLLMCGLGGVAVLAAHGWQRWRSGRASTA